VEPAEVRIGGTTSCLIITRARPDSAPADHVTWALELPGLRALDEVWLASWEGGPESLARFFADLATNWKGWEGTKEWAGGSGETRLAATHDGVGHVELAVTLKAHWRGQPPFPDEWAVSGVLALEPGSLEEIARGVGAVLGVPETSKSGDISGH